MRDEYGLHRRSLVIITMIAFGHTTWVLNVIRQYVPDPGYNPNGRDAIVVRKVEPLWHAQTRVHVKLSLVDTGCVDQNV